MQAPVVQWVLTPGPWGEEPNALTSTSEGALVDREEFLIMPWITMPMMWAIIFIELAKMWICMY